MFYLLLSLQLGVTPKYIVRMAGNRVQVLLSGQIRGHFRNAECFKLSTSSDEKIGKEVAYLNTSNVL